MRSRVAGPSRRVPSGAKRDPCSGHSHDWSASFQLTMPPKCGKDRNSRRQYALVGVEVEFVAVGGACVQGQPVTFRRNLLHANALHESSAPLVEFDDQAVQEWHGIELRLLGQPDAAVKRKRHIGVVDPLRLQSSRLARLVLRPCRRNTRLGLGVGVGVLALHRKAMSLTVLDQPLLALAISLDVVPRDLGPVFADDLRQLGALQHTDLCGGVAGCPHPRRVRLQHQHVLAGPGQ